MAIEVPYKRVGARAKHTVTTAVYTLPATPRDANAVILQTVTADVRFTIDSTDPSATDGGIIIHDQGEFLLPLNALTEVRFYRAAGADAPMTWQFVKVQNRW